MRPLVYTWPWALAFWAAFGWAFTPEFALIGRARTGLTGPDSRDGGSMPVILIGMQLAFFAAFPLASVRALRFGDAFQVAGYIAGTTCLVAGSLLRRHCWRQLGQYFTGNVQARADQPVVNTGAYAWVRHPSYSAGIIMNASIGLALGSWGSTLLLTVASVAVYAYRMHIEEQALAGTIGEPYREFMRTRKRLVPYLY